MKQRCSVCAEDVTDGLLEGGKPRHVACEPAGEASRVTLYLSAGALAIFKRWGNGNASLGARKAAEALAEKEVRESASPS